MRKKKFRCTHKDELEPENFCLGSVLADKLGADFMLCAIAVELFRHWNKDESYDIGITQAAEKDFILVDTFGLYPLRTAVPVRVLGGSGSSAVRFHDAFHLCGLHGQFPVRLHRGELSFGSSGRARPRGGIALSLWEKGGKRPVERL